MGHSQSEERLNNLAFISMNKEKPFEEDESRA